MNRGTLPGFGKAAAARCRVQAGEVLAAGTVTIGRVNPKRAYILSVSKGSAGYVAARGTVTLAPTNGGIGSTYAVSTNQSGGGAPSYSGPITGGATDLTVKEFGAKLTSPTTIYCDGPCEWQVVEQN